jgi:hypothetical protein
MSHTRQYTRKYVRTKDVAKGGTRDGKQIDDKAQMPTLWLFVMVNFASQTTRWQVVDQFLSCCDALMMVTI